MNRALELAQKGLGKVSPNPLVGCVVVHQDKILGEGYHEHFGGPHAEVNAFNSISELENISDSTVYVTLEPCSYYGKTPACTDLLLKHRPKRVVVGAIDPNPKVSGAGIKILSDAGIEVVTGVLNDECEELNRRFFTNIHKSRPYIILKWAQTGDGFIARENGDSKWISNESSRQLVHKWRANEDAILVGKETVNVDDPSLTVRDWQGENPVRVILDRKASLEGDLNVFDGSVRTIVYSQVDVMSSNTVERIHIKSPDYLESVLSDLYSKDIGSVLVEGGAKVLSSFINSGLWDEANIFTSTKGFGKGIAAPEIQGTKISEQMIESDRLVVLRNNYE